MKIAFIDDNKELLEEAIDYLEISIDDEVEFNIFSSISEYRNSKIDSEEWDLIFMDYNLQENMDGIKLAKMLIIDGFKNKFCFISGESSKFIKNKIKNTEFKDSPIIEKDNNLYENLVKEVNKMI